MTKNVISSDKWFIKDVFSQWFNIPDYQRPYVWGKDQIYELLDDVYESYCNNGHTEYFLGSMVLQKKIVNLSSSGQYNEYDVLDGQQRLTTLFLITAVIRDLTSQESRRNHCQNSIYRMANPDDGIPERIRITFTRSRVGSFINDYVKPEGATKKINKLSTLLEHEKDISVLNMAKAIKYIHSYFEQDTDQKIDEFFPFLRNKVLLIQVSSEKLDDAFRMFTVLNDRGLKLRNSDILKAENLRAVSSDTERSSFAELWEKMEEYFADDFDNFLSHIRTILVKDKARVNLLEEFENRIYSPKDFNRETKEYKSQSPLIKKGKDTFDLLKSHYKNHEQLFSGNNYSINSTFELDNMLTMLTTALPADYWIAPLLGYYEKFHIDNICTFTKLLDNKFSHDWILSLTPTDRIENMNNILRAIEKSSTSKELINNKSIFEMDLNSLKSSINDDIYGRRYARYLLCKLDIIYHGSDSKPTIPKTITVEHILPQNPARNSQWVSDFSESDREQWTNKIGNLVLISRRKNASQGNFDYNKKKKKYFKDNIELFSNSVRIYQEYDSWDINNLKDNHKKVVRKLMDHYSGYF